jgi:hypothetical protein
MQSPNERDGLTLALTGAPQAGAAFALQRA